MRSNEMLERRFEMCSFILCSGETHYSELMNEFGISKPTVLSDINFISKFLIPLETTHGRSGCVKVSPNAYKNLIRLSERDGAWLSLLYKAIVSSNMDMIREHRKELVCVLLRVIMMTTSPRNKDELEKI